MDTKPLLIYDGDCGFCRRWIAHWRQLTGDRVAYAPYQQVADQFPQIPRERFQAAVQLVEPDGRVTHGAEAVARTLGYVPGKRWFLWIYQRVPGAAAVFEWWYLRVAGHRGRYALVTQWLWGDRVGPGSYQRTRWIFLRLLGIIYAIAFASLWPQIHGLIGSRGISPIGELLQAAHRQLGPAAYHLLPTLCWIHAGDAMLDLLCGVGVALALCVVAGWIQRPALIGLWVSYLSLTVAGQAFLSFQWDVLLLETGFLAIFLAPGHLRPRWPSQESPPPTAILWLLRWLLFRLIFSSGLVKLASGDPTWRNLTALTYHYETQPLPNPVSWYAHQLPAAFHAASCAVMFAIELGAPFLIFTPRRLRAYGCWAMITLQAIIALTGNYAFFNLLAVALCLLLLDDAMWPMRLRPTCAPPPWRRRSWVTVPVAITIVVLSIVPCPWLAPFCLVNRYGLFAVMTTDRPEIMLEGSADGQTWRPYEFTYKPGDLTRPPPFVAPHQPRLDWQMWFAALGTPREHPWFLQLCERLLQGAPDTLALLKTNPFPEAPPQYLRATVYDYRFTTWAARRETATWWVRERRGPYGPVLSLRDH